MLNLLRLWILGVALLAGASRAFLLKSEYTDAWSSQVKISPHNTHKTFTQCLQNCAKPFLPNYNNEEQKPFLQKCVKNCMKYQYLCKNFNKCETLIGE